MKWVRFRHARQVYIGIEMGNEIVAMEGVPADWIAVVESGARILQGSRPRRIRRNRVRLLAPLQPRAILCAGQNYREHLEEKPPVPTGAPEFFLKLPDLAIHPGDPIVADRRVTRKLDHEAELAVVIGRPCRHVSARHARDYILGYTIMNDVTARDQQIRPNGAGGYDYFLGPGKNFDTAAPLGPCIVTADELGDPQSLAIRSFVNGELRQNASTAQMIWGVYELVAFFSRFVTLLPGYVISSGTPGRTAWGWDRELGGKRAAEKKGRPKHLYLRPGDVVRCEIEGIGALENPVAAPAR